MPKILIVDDIDVNRLTIKISLKSEKYTFLEASNGREAVDMALIHLPDIILMDAMMPVLDGFEATKEIRKKEELKRTPILMVTSLGYKEDKIKAIEAGVNDFISKPFDKEELKARCRSYVHISQLNHKYMLATVDPISNLYNKIALLDHIKNYKKSSELFIIKIENFENYENFYGNQIAKQLELTFIDKIKELYQEIIGNKYQIYHLSSGKYAILLQNNTQLESVEISSFCELFTTKIKEEKFSILRHDVNINIIMSFAIGKESLYSDANEVLNKAILDQKDYLVADQVINQLKEHLRRNLSMLQGIKVALKENKIFPYFQPIVNNRTGKVEKYEALIRMKDEHGYLIMPGPYFLNVAKQGKLYPQITKIVIEKVFQKIMESNVEISINLSSLDVEDPIMNNYILKKVKDNPQISRKVTFELLEDKDTQDYEMVKSFIKVVKSYGVKISIDDFGSGYSNFMRILEFEPDIIKIDGTLVKSVEHSQKSRNIIETIQIFATKMGAKTVAEYVSNREIYNIIRNMNVDYSQGFYFGKAEAELIDEQILEEAI